MSKLSRRKKASKKLLVDDSGEDFKVEDQQECRNNLLKETDAEKENKDENMRRGGEEEEEEDNDEEDGENSKQEKGEKQNLPDCPFCGKDFRSALTSVRAGHLKSCARKKGVATITLMEVVQLERKQAEERKALGLRPPSPLPDRNKRKPEVVKRPRTEDEGGADPDLALALALSLSVQQPSQVEIDQKRTGVPSSPKMWLPQPPKEKRRGGRKGWRPPTILECRTGAERQRIIGERVGSILYPENPPLLPKIIRRWEGGRLCAPDLLSIQDDSARVWNCSSSADQLTPSKLIVQELSEYMNPRLSSGNKESVPEVLRQEGIQGLAPSLARLSEDLLKLLTVRTGDWDLQIICRDERTVNCHKLVLQARCPVLLRGMVIEEDKTSTKQYIVLSQTDELIVQIVLEYIYGGVFNLHKITDRYQLQALKSLSQDLALQEMLNCIKTIQIDDVDEDEVENNDAPGVGSSGSAASRSATSPDDALEAGEASGTQALDALLDQLSQDNDEKEDRNEGDLTERPEAVLLIEENKNDNEWESFCEVLTQKRRKSLNDEDSDEENNDTEHDDSPVKDQGFDEQKNDSFEMDKFDDEDIMENEVNSARKKIEPALVEVTKTPANSPESRVCVTSPDMFAVSDDEVEDFQQNPQDNPEDAFQSLTAGARIESPILLSSRSPSKSPFQPLPSPEPSSPRPIPRRSLSFQAEPRGAHNSCSDVLETSARLEDKSLSPEQLEPSGSSSDGCSQPVFSFLASTSLEMSTPVNRKRKPSPCKGRESRKRSRYEDSDDYLPTPGKPREPVVPKDATKVITDEAEELLNIIKHDLLQGCNVKDCLESLLEQSVTVPLLLKTGIGKVVRKFKTHDGEVGTLSRRVVKKWLHLVDQCDTDLGVQLLSQQSVQQTQEEDQASRIHQKQSQSDTPDFSPNSDMPDFNPSPEIPDFNPSPEIPDFNPSPDKPEFNPSPEIPEFNPSPEIPEFNPSPDIPEFNLSPDKPNFPSPNLPDVNPGSEHPPSNYNPDHASDDLESPELRSANDRMDNGRPLKTPVNKRLLLQDTPKCTPKPNYESMLTPELRAELQRFGLKVVPRRKAVQFLGHIYNETHPIVNYSGGSVKKGSPIINKNLQRNQKIHRKNKSPKMSKKSTKTAAEPKTSKHVVKTSKKEQKENINEGSDFEDGSVSEGEDEVTYLGLEKEEEEDFISQIPNDLTLHDQLKTFIRRTPDLYQTILCYEPIWLTEFIAQIKQAGIKCTKLQILDFLDKECINFRFDRTNRRRENAAKTSPKKSQKNRGRPKQ